MPGNYWLPAPIPFSENDFTCSTSLLGCQFQNVPKQGWKLRVAELESDPKLFKTSIDRGFDSKSARECAGTGDEPSVVQKWFRAQAIQT
jgi:hypothetical protein